MKTNKHTLSHYRLLTGNMGQLLPFGLVEVVTNDTFQHSAQVFLRFSPMAAPVMHPVTVRVHHFFAPMRLLWPKEENGGFEEFITSGPDGTNSATIPTITIPNVDVGSLGDYLGLPTDVAATVSALPIRAFNAIFNEYYRDEDLVPERQLDDVTIPKIAWEKDYFTTARPWPQKGPAVTIGLGTDAPIILDPSAQPNPAIVRRASNHTGTGSQQALEADASSNFAGLTTGESVLDPNGTLIADLANATSIDVTDLREAFALQRYAEARARYGSRFVEYLKYLGARPQDSRLQRPELLAGGRARVNISEVLQTANEASQTRFGVGDLYGHGVAALRSNAYRRNFPEPGYVLSMLSVRPAAMYMNGTHRTWLRRTREEFWQRELQHVGQQEVWEGEIYSTGVSDYQTFGYQDRYSEYRQVPSGVSGEFRSTLDYWHLARDFATGPALNQAFVECDPSKRIFNVQNEDTLWIATQHNLVARRLVAKNATPKIL